jgi:hypothetical protein
VAVRVADRTVTACDGAIHVIDTNIEVFVIGASTRQRDRRCVGTEGRDRLLLLPVVPDAIAVGILVDAHGYHQIVEIVVRLPGDARQIFPLEHDVRRIDRQKMLLEIAVLRRDAGPDVLTGGKARRLRAQLEMQLAICGKALYARRQGICIELYAAHRLREISGEDRHASQSGDRRHLAPAESHRNWAGGTGHPQRVVVGRAHTAVFDRHASCDWKRDPRAARRGRERAEQHGESSTKEKTGRCHYSDS